MEALGAVGTTVSYTAAAEAQPGGENAALKALVDEMQHGRVEMLVVLGANAVYAAPADLKIAEALDKVPFRVHHGTLVDETAETRPARYRVKRHADGQVLSCVEAPTVRVYIRRGVSVTATAARSSPSSFLAANASTGDSSPAAVSSRLSACRRKPSS